MSKTSTEPPIRIALNGPTMGSRWTAVAFAPAGLPTAALQRELQAAVDLVDGQMSSWKPDSDLNRLNGATVGSWITIPTELARVLATSLAIGAASDGAFDIGVGDLVIAWGFGPGRGSPDPDLIGAAAGRGSVQAHTALQVDVKAGRARKLAPVTLDLSGIAKGFGVDELGRVMIRAGFTSWLVGIDGEMAGRRPEAGRQAVARGPRDARARPARARRSAGTP